MTDDLEAITNAFRYPWSTGPVEGHITRVKLIKRAGYGRAKLPVLRGRIFGPNYARANGCGQLDLARLSPDLPAGNELRSQANALWGSLPATSCKAGIWPVDWWRNCSVISSQACPRVKRSEVASPWIALRIVHSQQECRSAGRASVTARKPYPSRFRSPAGSKRSDQV
jgi:hypothetical protein